MSNQAKDAKHRHLQQLIDNDNKSSDKWIQIGCRFTNCITTVKNGVTRFFIDGTEQSQPPKIRGRR